MTKTFKVENYKGIRGTVEVSPTGTSVIVSGKNAAGKSSFIDGIAELFDYRGARLTPRPINEDASQAVAEFTDTELDVRIVREWTRKADGGVASKLSVYALDGARHSKPADVIAKLTGGLIFDPSRFLMMDPKPQRDALMQKVQLPFDLAALEGEEASAEETRLKRGQEARAAEGAVSQAEKPAPGTPREPVATADLVAMLEAARDQNARKADVERAARTAGEQIVDVEHRLDGMRKETAALEASLVRLRESQSEAVQVAASLETVDTTDLEAQIAGVDETNRNVQLGQILARQQRDADEKREAYRAADDLVKEIVARKVAGLKEAVFPDPHLSVDDSGVLFDGVPFSQANSAARNRAAFSIATAGDSELKLVIVKEGDLLDEDSLSQIDEVAQERGFTVLVERGRPDVGGLVATFVEMADGAAA